MMGCGFDMKIRRIIWRTYFLIISITILTWVIIRREMPLRCCFDHIGDIVQWHI